MKLQVMGCLLALGIASCAASSAEKPRQAQIGAHEAVKAAEQVVASNRAVDAEQNLASARADIQTGERLFTAGDYEVARLYFERAQAEATASIAQARAHEAEQKTATIEVQPKGGRGS